MSELADVSQVDAGRGAMPRLRMHVGAMALLTGFGLAFVGDLRDPGGWLTFAGMTSLAFVAVAVWGHRQKNGSDVAPASKSREVEKPPTAQPGSSNPRKGPSRHVPPPEIDYLMALRHEFRTPLNAVLGFSDVLLRGIDGEVNPSQREDIEIIRASGIRLRILLDSALDLSQLADGELRLETDRADVRELVRRSAVEAGQLWSSKRAARFELPAESLVASVDEVRLRRTILVLADCLAAHHRDAEIRLGLSGSGETLSIELSAHPSDDPVLDSLPTPREVLDAEDIAAIRRWPLAVTSEIITLHRGSLYHGSTPSRFLIRLPMEVA